MVIMDDLIAKFIEWAVYDEIGDIIGVEENAPQRAKYAYKDFCDILAEAKEAGVKI